MMYNELANPTEYAADFYDITQGAPQCKVGWDLCAGIGSARTPPVYLKPGDRIECAVEGIGRQNNPIAQGLP